MGSNASNFTQPYVWKIGPGEKKKHSTFERPFRVESGLSRCALERRRISTVRALPTGFGAHGVRIREARLFLGDAPKRHNRLSAWLSEHRRKKGEKKISTRDWCVDPSICVGLKSPCAKKDFDHWVCVSFRVPYEGLKRKGGVMGCLKNNVCHDCGSKLVGMIYP